MKKFNINNYVKVKLTDYGKEIYYHQFDKTNERLGKEIIKPRMPTLDDEGYLKDQLWKIMSVFGEYISLGSKQPFDTDILL